MQRAIGKGNFITPAIFTNVRPDMTIAQEEIFCPVLSVIPFSSEDEAVRIANATMYGLTATVWASNLAIGHRLKLDRVIFFGADMRCRE